MKKYAVYLLLVLTIIGLLFLTTGRDYSELCGGSIVEDLPEKDLPSLAAITIDNMKTMFSLDGHIHITMFGDSLYIISAYNREFSIPLMIGVMDKIKPYSHETIRFSSRPYSYMMMVEDKLYSINYSEWEKFLVINVKLLKNGKP
jgi:hypothetical protein